MKLLLVVTEFWQAGCQRYNYEFDKAINKSKFYVEILSFRNLQTNENWPDYYYEKHIELGTEVRFFDSFKKRSFKRERKLNQRDFQLYLDSFDKVIFQGEYCWRRFSKYVLFNSDNYFISLHNSVTQSSNNYLDYDKNFKYNFISSFSDDQLEFELKEFKEFNHFHFPLSISANWNRRWEVKSTKKKLIGIFTRLTVGKPLEPFLYSFQVLLNEFPEAELHIYGTGDPEEVGLIKHIKLLNLGDNVKFKGHAENMLETVIEAEISLVWFHSYHKIPGGFASFELSSIGIPQFFWEIIPEPFFLEKSPFLVTNKITELANQTVHFFQRDDFAENVSEIQFNKIFETRNIDKNIKELENYFLA